MIRGHLEVDISFVEIFFFDWAGYLSLLIFMCYQKETLKTNKFRLCFLFVLSWRVYYDFLSLSYYIIKFMNKGGIDNEVHHRL